MRRRQFLQLAGSAAFAVRPMTALAQKGTSLPLVAMLVPGSAEFARRRVEALRAGIKEAGLVEGVDYAFTVRFADGDFARLPSLAKELDALKPRVFVASAAAARTVHEVLPDAPLVFTSIATDPISFGLVQSYTHPGGNATGNVMNAEGGEESLTEKRIGFFRELAPQLKRLALIGTETGVLTAAEENALRRVASNFGFSVTPYAIKTLDGLKDAFSAALRDGAEAFYISGDSILFNNMSQVMALVAATQKPSVGTYTDWARAGLLMTYSADLLDDFRRAGIYVAKIVRGAKPGDLPVEQASKFVLAVNVKTAKELGIVVPPSLLAIADEVIE